MSDKIVELDQIDERNFDLGQEAEQQFDLGNPEVVVISGVRVQENPVDKGVAIYDQQDDELKTIVPDQEVTQNSENLVTSGAVYNYVEHHAGNVADVQVDDNSVVDNNKLAKLSTINGNYNASTNKLATESDLPTQASDVHALPDSTKYGASLDLANGSTLQLKDQDGNDLGSPVTISTEDTGATSVEVVGNGNAVTDASYSSANRKITLTKGTEFQTATDNSLNTDAKNVVSAINEVNTVAKNANIAKGFTSYSALITDLNSATATAYKVGQSFYVQTLDVPDLWVISVEASSVAYTYTTDSAFETATAVAGGQQVGYYKLGQLETQKTDLSNYVQKTTTIAGVDLQDNITQSEMQTALDFDTKVDKTSLTKRLYGTDNSGNQDVFRFSQSAIASTIAQRLSGGRLNVGTPTETTNATTKDYVDSNDTIKSISAGGTALTPDTNKNVNIPVADENNLGLVKIHTSQVNFNGIGIVNGELFVQKAGDGDISSRINNYKPLVSPQINTIVKAALSDTNHLTMNTTEQDTAQSVLGVNILTGSSAPTTSTVGRVGQLYKDTTNDKLYICDATTTENDVTTYTWTKLIKETDVADIDNLGIVKVGNGYSIAASGRLAAQVYTETQYKNIMTAGYNIGKGTLENIKNTYVKEAFTDTNHLTMTAEEQATAQSVLGIDTLIGDIQTLLEGI